MNVRTLWVIFLLAPATLTGQQVTVSLPGYSGSRAALSALSGEKAAFLDSIAAGSPGSFSFTLGPERAHGIYRLSVERGKWIDFVHDGEEVQLRSDIAALAESLTVIRSESNRLYYAFRRLNQRFKTKSEILQLVLARYPREDPFHETTTSTARSLQAEYRQFIASSSDRSASFAARYIRSAQLPVVDLTLPLDQQLAFLKAYALDMVDFRDETLVRSDLFTSKSIEYLMYYRNPQLPKELLAREFNAAVDSILNRAKVNQTVYRHITEYLIDGFKQFGFEECINYILENYVIKDDLCLDESSGSSVQRMIDQKKRLPVGAVAPEVTLPDTSGNPVSLSAWAGKKALVVFYSTACPHCQTMVPQLWAFAKEKSLPVLAVSLDANVHDWLGFVRTHGLGWANVIDLQGWGGTNGGGLLHLCDADPDPSRRAETHTREADDHRRAEEAPVETNGRDSHRSWGFQKPCTLGVTQSTGSVGHFLLPCGRGIPRREP